jgi:hypothetical protein
MNARERVAQKSGDIKVFLMPQEVGLLVSCLNWVQLDLVRAANIWETNADIKKQATKETLNHLIPVIESTVKSILLHSRAHYEERHDEKGLEFLLERISESGKRTSTVQALVHKIYRAAITKEAKSQN